MSDSEKSGLFYGYIVVIASFFIMILMWGTYYSFGVFFKVVLTEFGWTRAMTSGAFSLSMMVHGIIAIFFGGLNDRLGPRAVMTLCGLMLGLGYLLMSQTSNIWQLYLYYGVIIGFGMGGSWVPLLSTVARWFTRRRSLMSGVVLAGTGIGALIAPPAASWVISTYNWRVSFMVLGIVALVLIVLAAQFLKRDPAQVGQMPHGIDEKENHVIEKDLSLQEAIRTSHFWIFFVMLFCFGFCMFGSLVHIVPHATDLGIPAVNSAGILSIIGAMAVVGRLGLGSAADRIGNRQVFIIGYILMSIDLFWLISIKELWMLYLFAAVFGLSYGGMGAAESPFAAQFFGLGSHGLIYGIVCVGFTTGAAVGPFTAGYIYDVNGNYTRAFLISAIVAVLALVLTLFLKPPPRKSKTAQS